MNILKSIANFLSPPRPISNVAWVNVQCNRCGETLQCRINLNNDLSVQYGADETDITYYCRKMVIGEQKCFQKVELELTFDKNKKLTDNKVSGGKFIEVSY